MKISNIVSSAAAGAFALGLTASVASAETCVVALPFDFGSAAVSATNQGLLDVIRSNYGDATVNLAGYTDAVGSAASNLVLSQRRSQTVSNYLTQGTSINVVNSTGFGESNLKVADTGPNQLNRRVEITIEPCDPALFGTVPGATVDAGALGSAGIAAAVLGAVVIIGALGSGGDGTDGTGTGTGTATGTGAGN